jgi:hypothetical protein
LALEFVDPAEAAEMLLLHFAVRLALDVVAVETVAATPPWLELDGLAAGLIDQPAPCLFDARLIAISVELLLGEACRLTPLGEINQIGPCLRVFDQLCRLAKTDDLEGLIVPFTMNLPPEGKFAFSRSGLAGWGHAPV